MMDLLNEPIERITRRVKEGGIELSEIPLTRRKKVEAALTDFSSVVELPDPAAELEADKAKVRAEVAAKKSKSLSKMNIAELQAELIERKIMLPKKAGKTDMVRAIKEARKNAR